MQYYETLHYALNGVTTESSHHKTILSVYATTIGACKKWKAIQIQNLQREYLRCANSA